MEMVKEKLRYIIIIVMILIVAILLFFANKTKDKMVISVDGWDMEYTISERKLVIEDFENIELGSSLDEIENKLGKPDGWVGGGTLLPVYVLEDNSAVELVFRNDATNEDLEAIYLYNAQNESVIKKNSTPEEIVALGLPEDMLAYWMVLNSKQPFISTDEGYQEFYWDEYYWHLGSPVERHQADYFMIVDMDGDGADEMILNCTPESTQVLHYEDGEVYSYQFVFRGMKRIHSDGIYEGSNGAASTSYHRLTELNKSGYTEETIAVMDGDYYEVEGIEATHEEFSAYVQTIENVELAESMEFTEGLIDKCLLGDLSEEKLLVVRHAPIKEMKEMEMNVLMEEEEVQAYRAVLLNEKSFISVTDDNREYYLNNYHLRKGKYNEEFQILYFSIVDMDQDDVCELVLTGGYITQIMHYEEGQVYSYQFDYNEIGAIAKDGVFLTGYDNSYSRIASFNKDGYEIEPVEDYEGSNHDRIRYYFFSEDTINQWLK